MRALLAAVLDPTFPAPVPVRHAQTREVGHGRIERRRLWASSVLSGRTDWPGLAQVFRLERYTREKKTGKARTEVVYGITDLTPQQAGPKTLLRLARGHWSIENRSHYVRDVTFDEDRSQVRCGSIPQVLAAVRNVAIGLLRRAGHPNIAAATRRYAAQPWEALALLGIVPNN